MKYVYKRIASFLLALVMAASIIPAGFALEETQTAEEAEEMQTVEGAEEAQTAEEAEELVAESEDVEIPLDIAESAYSIDEEGVGTAEVSVDVTETVTLQEAGEYSGKTVILHSNDVHGAIAGYAYIAALAERFRTQGADVILADAGDFSQGDPNVSFSKGADAVAMMNAAGYDVATLGNHEFDYGYAQLRENLESATFHVICADVYEGDDLVLEPTWMYEGESGLKIGFFGMETPETQTKVNPGLIQGIRFVSNINSSEETLYTCAQTQIDALHSDGADIVIALSHLGVDEESAPDGHRSIDLYRNTSGIDLMLDGHSHTVMTCWANDAPYNPFDSEAEAPGEGKEIIPVQSTGTKFAYVGVVVVDNESKAIEDHYLLSTEGMEANPAVAAAAQEIADRINQEYGEVIATSEIFLNGGRAPGNRTEETNLGDLIADAMVWKVLREDGALTVDDDHVVGITNGGGIRASIQPGDVTRRDLNTVLPFGNTVSVVYVTGAELLEALEASTYATPEALGAYPQTFGITFTLDTTKAYDQGEAYPESTYYRPATIQRVTITAINEEAFDPEATYAVVTNNFCAAGGDTYFVFKNASAQFDTGIVMDEAVMEYVQDALGGVISAETYGEPRGDQTILLAPSVTPTTAPTTQPTVAPTTQPTTAPTTQPTVAPTGAPGTLTPTPTPASEGSSNQGCYVATCVYGSYDCPEVWTLRRLRDEVLAETWYGRLFIHAYYAVSPTAVRLFGNCDWFQNFFRAKLDQMVANLQAEGFASTPYDDPQW